MESSPDVQREFYEKGYAANSIDSGAIIADFTRLPAGTRIGRAATLLEDCSGTFLDVGCGGGPLLHQVRGHFSQLIGVDIADAQLDRVRGWSAWINQPVQLHRYNVDTDPLPLECQSVDAAACMVVLDFILRPEYLTAEIARVLRPGGRFVCSVGNIVSWKNRLRVMVGLDPRTTVFMNALNGGALHHFTRKTFLAMLVKAGFEIEKVSCSGRWWQVRQYWPALLGGDILVVARKSRMSPPIA